VLNGTLLQSWVYLRNLHRYGPSIVQLRYPDFVKRNTNVKLRLSPSPPWGIVRSCILTPRCTRLFPWDHQQDQCPSIFLWLQFSCLRLDSGTRYIKSLNFTIWYQLDLFHKYSFIHTPTPPSGQIRIWQRCDECVAVSCGIVVICGEGWSIWDSGAHPQNQHTLYFSFLCLQILRTLSIWSWLYLGFHFILRDILNNGLKKYTSLDLFSDHLWTYYEEGWRSVSSYYPQSKNVVLYPIPAWGEVAAATVYQ
jgi:hypothetical protein